MRDNQMCANFHLGLMHSTRDRDQSDLWIEPTEHVFLRNMCTR